MSDYNTIAQEFADSSHRDADALKRLYWKWDLTIKEIAEGFGVTPSTVHYWMDKRGVPRNSPSKNGIKLRTSKRGYESWTHHEPDSDEQNNVLAHRLLAVAEYGVDAVKGSDVHHKNGIRWDNRPENIEVMSKQEHMEHHMTGSGNNTAKLSADDIREIRRRSEQGPVNIQNLAAEFDVSDYTIRDILKRETWTHIE